MRKGERLFSRNGEHGNFLLRYRYVMTANDRHFRHAAFATIAIFAFGTGAVAWAQTEPAAGGAGADPATRGIVLRLPVDVPPSPEVPDTDIVPLPLDASQRVRNPVVIQLPPPGVRPEDAPSPDIAATTGPSDGPVAADSPLAQRGEPANRPALIAASTAIVQNEGPSTLAPPEPAAPTALPDTPAGAAADDAAGTGWLGLIALGLAGLIPIALAVVAMVWVRRRTESV